MKLAAVLAAALSLSSLVRAQTLDPADQVQSVWQLHDAFVSSTDRAEQLRLLDALAQTKPASSRDLSDLFDLFARYPQSQTRDAAVASLNRITPADFVFAPTVMDYLTQPEPKTQFFAILAETHLRDPKALPIIRTIAKRKFAVKEADNTPVPGEQDAWWTQYEALDALAAWEGAGALKILEKQALFAPDVTRIISAHFWPVALPKFMRWAASRRQNEKDAAHQGLSAPVPLPDLRSTRAEMLSAVLDPQKPVDARHYLALKVGLASDDAQVAALIKTRDSQADAQTKLYLLGAIYASRSPLAIPLLTNDAKTNADPAARRGALVELKEVMKPADYQALALWVSQNDADPGLRDFAASEAAETSSPKTTKP